MSLKNCVNCGGKYNTKCGGYLIYVNIDKKIHLQPGLQLAIIPKTENTYSIAQMPTALSNKKPIVSYASDRLVRTSFNQVVGL